MVQMEMLNVGFFRVLGIDGLDHGLLLEPDYTMDPSRIKKDFEWKNLLAKSGLGNQAGPTGILFYHKGGTDQWPSIAFEENYKDQPGIRVMFQPPEWRPIIIDDSEKQTRRIANAHRN
ncbi:hypothetical protein LCGC14_0450930 [marine sediment metagenome]|uniref:Uncharacterized protein n=1 Tax=marine sediment metagenome TaxID=412755 RepID=A0A0F9T109_9ZZZZ